VAKRFTDTLIWEKEWFMKLSPKHKCFFRYLVDRCDSSGVWEPNYVLASIYIGETIDFSDTLLLSSQIETLANGKIWVKDFILFQYGKLSEKCPAHIPVYKTIEKNKLTHRVFNSLSNRLEEKETDKEEENEKETVKINKESISKEIFNDELYIQNLQSAHRGKDIKQAFEECYIHHSNAPNPPFDLAAWRQKLNTWLSNTNSNDRKSNKTTPSGTPPKQFTGTANYGTGLRGGSSKR
jgi:hypothetical protein